MHRGAISIRLFLLALVVAGAAGRPEAEAAQAPPDQKRVLVIYSTRRDSLISEAAERILTDELNAAFGVQLDYYSEYIDPARFPDADFNGFADFMRRRYPDLKPDLVIAVEDAALGFVTGFRDTLFPGTPVLFFSRDPAVARLPNSTGVIEPIDFARTLDLITALQPEVTEVILLSGDSARDRAYLSAAQAQFQPYAGRLTFTVLAGLPVEDLERRLAALPPNAVVYPLLVSQLGDANFRPAEINDRLARLANRPTYGWHERHLGLGFVGGSLLQLAPGLRMLAERAVRVVGGEKASDIDVARPHVQIDRVDGRQLRRWGLSEARVPAGFVVEFQEATIWQRYRVYLVGIGALILAQSALIAGLLVQARRRRQAERELRRSQEELTESYARIRDVGGRLLVAQEAERSRIARDLHDDISQQMALLELDLREPGGHAAALDRVAGISRSVHELSHRLHPATLRLMGLVASLRALQREHARTGLPVQIVDRDVPNPLSPELTLCLFRVVQETLQNAAKYSEASEVVVELSGHNGRLRLTVADDGVGFDVERAWGKGLGLISIRERVEACGGTVSVESSSEGGTRVVVDVPAPSTQAHPSPG